VHGSPTCFSGTVAGDWHEFVFYILIAEGALIVRLEVRSQPAARGSHWRARRSHGEALMGRVLAKTA